MSTLQLLGMAVAAIAGLLLVHELVRRALGVLLGLAFRLTPALRRAGARAHAHPLRKAFALRWPRVHGWLAARTDTRRFAGLPLTLVVVAALYAGGLFAGLIDDVLTQDGVVRFDERINGWFAAYRMGPPLQVFLWISALGASPAMVAVAVVASASLWCLHRRRMVLPLWLALLGAEATTWSGKFVLGRARPAFIDGVTAVGPAFPSGHATASLAVYGFIAYALARALPDARGRFELAFWTGVLVAAIGLSRVFLGVHYTSDVLGGWLVGAFWLLTAVAAAEHRSR